MNLSSHSFFKAFNSILPCMIKISLCQTSNFLSFFKKVYLFEKQIFTKGEEETEKEVFLLVHSPNNHNICSWVNLKSGASFQVSHVGVEVQEQG